jgi:hypothetical protein
MVTSRVRAFFSVPCLAIGLLSIAAGCQTVEPVTVYQSFKTNAGALATQSPSQIAVLPIENGTGDPAIDRHLLFFRQELIRELPLRYYSGVQQTWVDASLRELNRVTPAAASLLDPAWLAKVAAAVPEEAVLAVRLDRWDESLLLVDRRIDFQLQAALVGKDGTQLWYGTLSGKVKAGGAGAAPRDREYMVRSCIELVVSELFLQLPEHDRR